MEFWITCLSTDGVITCRINNKEYEYKIDAAHYPTILKLKLYHPGKALNFIKKHGQLIKKEEVCLNQN